MRITLRRASWLMFAACGLVGCEGQDGEHLSRIAERAALRIHALTDGADTKLAAGWQAFRGNVDEAAPEARVTVRLRWEKALQGASVEAHLKEGVLELSGKVKDLDQRRRAVELAETTVGVEKVNDLLEIPATEP